VFGLEGRYATALYSAASKQNQLDAVEKELVKFKVCFVLQVSLLDVSQLP
jgi:F-type H+-transporting ATPase subunit O